MSESEAIKQIIDLANFRLSRWMDRRKHEWTISAGLWVGLGATALSGKIRVCPTALAALLIAFVFAHAVFWVRYNWTRNQADLREAFNYVGQAHDRLLIGTPPCPPDSSAQKWLHKHCSRLEFIAAPPCLFEMLISAFVAFFVFLNRCTI